MTLIGCTMMYELAGPRQWVRDIGQVASSYDPDRQTAMKRAMDRFRWFTGDRLGCSSPR